MSGRPNKPGQQQLYEMDYRQSSDITRAKSQNLNVSRLVL